MDLPIPPHDDDDNELLEDLLDATLAAQPAEGDAPQAAQPQDEDGATPPVEDPAVVQRAAERAGEGEVAGYFGPYANGQDRVMLSCDVALRQKLVGFTRRKRVPESDVEDVVQEAVSAATFAARLPGGSGEPRDKYVFGVLGFKIAEYWRERRRQLDIAARAQLYFARPVRAADPVAERDLVAKLPTIVKRGQLDDLTCLIRHRVGRETLTDLARERNEDYDAFAKRIKRLGKKVNAKIAAMGGIFAVLLGVALQPHPDHPLAFDEPGPVALLEPAVSTHVGETDPMDWAQVLRGEAFRSCMASEWAACLHGLDAARNLDPDGDDDPVVAAARKDAMDGYMAGLKPGSTWRPPLVRPYASRASR